MADVAGSPLVSFIVPLYNTAAYLRECLDSLLAQTSDAWEAVVIDDGSSDDSLAIARAYAARDGRFTVLEGGHAGPGAVRNRAIGHARGDYLAFLDSDDFVDPRLVELASDKARATDADVVVWDVWFFNDAFSRRQNLFPGTVELAPFMECGPSFSWKSRPDLILWNLQTWIWNKLFRRSFILDNDIRFDEGIERSEDIMFTYPALMEAGRMAAVPEKLVCYRTANASSAMATKDRHPFDFIRAVLDFRAWLVGRGLYDEVRRSFDSWAVSSCFYNLDTLKTREASAQVYRMLKDEVFDALEVTDLPPEAFLAPHLHDRIRDVMELTFDEYVFARLKAVSAEKDTADALLDFARSDNAGLVGERDAARSALDDLARTHDEIMGAAEQRIGRLVCAAPRAVQRRLIERRRRGSERKEDIGRRRAERAETLRRREAEEKARACAETLRKRDFDPESPLLSVLVPVYNVERYLGECLDSLIGQTLQDIEIICIDDGSTDSSPAILRDYAARDGRIRIITKENGGYGQSMNRGLDAARGKYIGIVESDDFADPHMFEALCSYADAFGLDVVKSNYIEHSDEGDALHEAFFEFDYGRLFDPAKLTHVMTVRPIIWAGVYRRDLLEGNAIRFLESPGASYQDTSFAQRIWMCAHRAMLLEGGYLHYRVDNVASSVKSRDKVYACCEEYALSESFMRASEERTRIFAPTLNVMKIDTYRWNYNRIAPEFREEFAERMAEEFAAARDEGTLDASLFKPGDHALIERLMDDPRRFARDFADGIPW